MADKNRNRSNQDWDQNRMRNNREDDYNQNRENYDSYGNVNYGRENDENRRYGNTGSGHSNYGNQQRQENDQNRRQGAWGGAGNYGADYGQANYGNEYGTGNYGGQRNRSQPGNMYGGDTRNYGNANQGGVDRDWWDRTTDEVSSWFGDDEAERRRRQDKQQTGQHKGKGPKGYTRSDERIQHDVCDRLSDDDRLDATDIEVKVENAEVTLTGTVSDREQKRRAEDLVEAISGVRDVENRIKVKREGAAAHTTSQIASEVAGNTSGSEWNRNKNV